MSALVDELRALGLQTAPIDPYSRDESGCGEYPPQAAVQARDATEVQKVLAFSRGRRIPVVPRGAGSDQQLSGEGGLGLARAGLGELGDQLQHLRVGEDDQVEGLAREAKERGALGGG